MMPLGAMNFFPPWLMLALIAAVALAGLGVAGATVLIWAVFFKTEPPGQGFDVIVPSDPPHES
jgi:hypothetical protein